MWLAMSAASSEERASFTPPAFAAATGVDLRFDDDEVGVRSQAVRRLTRFILGEGDFAAGRRDAVAGKDRLGLVFMNLHRGSVFRSALKLSASVRILTSCETQKFNRKAETEQGCGKWPRNSPKNGRFIAGDAAGLQPDCDDAIADRTS